ncbi:MAG: phosphoesterase, partial [Silvibacterium sp.]
MTAKQVASAAMRAMRTGLISTAIFQLSIGNAFAGAQLEDASSRDSKTASPIKHVIVIIGENRSFDHVFATYVPKKGEKVWNLLSEGIIKADGTPGPNFSKAEQTAAYNEKPDAFLLSPAKTTFQGDALPAPLVGGPQDSYVPEDNLALATQSENGLPTDYYAYLVTGGTGQSSRTPDARIKNVNDLPPGPFQLTNGDMFTYNSYAASPVHRFYQMWQQLDCDADRATNSNP